MYVSFRFYIISIILFDCNLIIIIQIIFSLIKKFELLKFLFLENIKSLVSICEMRFLEFILLLVAEKYEN